MLDELRAGLPDADVLVVDDGSTDRTAEVARGARGGGALVRREPRPARRDRGRATRTRTSTATPSPAASTPTGSTRSPSSRGCSRSSAPGEADVAVGSRFARGPGLRGSTATSRARAGGSAPRVLRRGMRAALGRPFHDATSGLYAVNARAMPILAEPYESGAPEVESLLRLARGRADGGRGARGHARARERRVEAARQEGGPARRSPWSGRSSCTASGAGCRAAMTRVVAVCGYSDGRDDGAAPDLRAAPATGGAGGRAGRRRPAHGLGATRRMRRRRPS